MKFASKSMTIVASVLHRYVCEIIIIQEIKWTNVGNIRICDATIFYICGQIYEHRVGFIVINNILPWLKKFIMHSE